MALISFVWTCVDLIILHCTTQLPCKIPVFLTPTTFCFFSYSTILHYYWTLHNLSLFFSPQSTKNGYFTRFFFISHTLTVLEAVTPATFLFLEKRRARKRTPNSKRESSTSNFFKLNEPINSIISIQSIKQNFRRKSLKNSK